MHVLSDSERRAAGIILTPISFKTFSHVFYNEAAQQSQQVKYLMRSVYKLKEKRRFNATRKAQRLLCILYLNQHCGALLLNKIHLYLFGQDFRVSCLLGGVEPASVWLTATQTTNLIFFPDNIFGIFFWRIWTWRLDQDPQSRCV